MSPKNRGLLNPEQHFAFTGQPHPDVATKNIELMKRPPDTAPAPGPWVGASAHEDSCTCERCTHLTVNGAHAA
jgi:hypothetical protein